jgi:hypothetical protein
MPSGLELGPPSDPPPLKGLTPAERVETMVEWFFDNFEDPANSTPYEGEYIYIWGGPYDAEEEIADAFGDIPEDELAEVVEQIHMGGPFDWAPNGNRLRPDNIDDEADAEEAQPLAERLAELQAQLDELKEVVDAIKNVDPMLGHNQPPAEYRLGLEDVDIGELSLAIDEIRAELNTAEPQEDANPENLERANGRLRGIARKLGRWIAAGAVAGAVGMVEQIGGELWEDPAALYAKIESIVHTVTEWIFFLVSLI